MKKRVLYFDFLRWLATVAVVMIHVSSVVCDAEKGSVEYWTGFFYNAPVRWGVPVFVMLSGALFLNPRKVISLKSLYSKYVLRLLVLFFSWSFIYPQLLWPLMAWIRGTSIKPVTPSFVYHYPGHLWFLPMLAGVYMMLPMLKLIAQKKKVMDYFLILWLVFSVVAFIPGLFADAVALLQVRLVLDYTGYFLLGYRLSITEIKTRKKTKVLLFFIFSLVLMYAMIIWKPEAHSYQPLAPNVILLSASVFLLGKNMDNRIEKARALKKVMDFAKGDLLGIYLIHPFYLDLLYKPEFIGGLPAAVSIPLFTVIIFVLSLFTIKLLRKIPGVRYICS